jgi:hypothetical protein
MAVLSDEAIARLVAAARWHAQKKLRTDTGVMPHI